MCGRFVGFRNAEQLQQYFPIDEMKCETVANFNVAPTQKVLAIVRENGSNLLDRYHWGLVPFWARDTGIGSKLINARSETLSEKPSFREAFKRRRCLIPADGFYEWTGTKGDRQPVLITLPDRSPFAFAGLWESWQDKKKEKPVYRSCTIITRAATGAVKAVHHRMPAILHPDMYDQWIDPDHYDLESLNQMLNETVVTDLIFHPVTKKMNSVSHNTPANLKPVQTEFDF